MKSHASNVASPPTADADQRPSPRWIVNGPVDLLIGCGGWTLPVLAVTSVLGAVTASQWAAVFYALALVANYPHYMATLHRACASPHDRKAHRGVVVGSTVLVVGLGLLAHASTQLLPWIVTAYVFWSPWHYSGQNFGLAMMQLRRAGIEPTSRERARLWAAFAVSYALLLVGLNSGPQTDPLVRSMQLPPGLAAVAIVVCSLAFVVSSAAALTTLEARAGARALVPAATLVATQAFWFVVPTLLTTAAVLPQAPTRYSAGALALMHSAQYLWITQYYARRDVEARSGEGWRPSHYALLLVVGGIALFVPAPWLMSRLAGVDFSSSVLACTALLNIQHFIVDGAVWKLRDPRVAARLVTHRERSVRDPANPPRVVSRRQGLTATRMLRVAMVAGLVAWALLDQVRYVLAGSRSDRAALEQAVWLSPHDSAARMRLAAVSAREGDLTRAIDEARRAVALQPNLPDARRQLVKWLLEARREAEADAEIESMLAAWPDAIDALVNSGLLARARGDDRKAEDRWRRVVELDPSHVRVHLYLADLLRSQSRNDVAVGGYERYLELVTERGDPFSPDRAEPVQAMLAAAELHRTLGHDDRVSQLLRQAEELATRLERPDLADRAREAQKAARDKTRS